MLPCRSGRVCFLGAALALLSLFLVARAASSAATPTPTASGSGTPKRQIDLTNLPLPIGHEAKGLVLPQFNLDGHQIGGIEAASARRTDQNHVVFNGIKLTTYTEANQPDLEIHMSESVLDLQTHLITSPRRTTVQRSDFSISGDAFEFNPNTHIGSLRGNVKMVLNGKDHLAPPQKPSEPEQTERK